MNGQTRAPRPLSFSVPKLSAAFPRPVLIGGRARQKPVSL